MKYVRGKREKSREKPTQILFCLPENPHGMNEKRTRNHKGGRRATTRRKYFIVCNNHTLYTSIIKILNLYFKFIVVLLYFIIQTYLKCGLPIG